MTHAAEILRPMITRAAEILQPMITRAAEIVRPMITHAVRAGHLRRQLGEDTTNILP